MESEISLVLGLGFKVVIDFFDDDYLLCCNINENLLFKITLRIFQNHRSTFSPSQNMRDEVNANNAHMASYISGFQHYLIHGTL